VGQRRLATLTSQQVSGWSLYSSAVILGEGMVEPLHLKNTIATTLDTGSARVRANREALSALMRTMADEEARIREGGGAKAAEAQHGKGRLTVRERLKLLLDEGT
jgi:3-methylcrotonyl-CoA carboxylase beta subunit